MRTSSRGQLRIFLDYNIFYMKGNTVPTYLFVFFTLFGLTGCDLIGDIFEAGFWTATIIIILVVVLVIWLIRKFLR